MHFEGTGDIADAILAGTYDTSQAPTEAARWVIEALKYAAGSTEAIDAFVTPEELVGKLRTWNERTSTSPMTKVHLGMGKPTMLLPRWMKTPQNTEHLRKTDKLSFMAM